jgi:hypothetical protein
MRACPQCGRDISNRGEFVRYCSKGCENAYKRDNPDIVLGLVGKAIGGAISGAKEGRQERAQQKAEEQEQRKAEREERDRQFAEEKAAASAARHVITHEVVCPICDADVSASMASDGETKVRCKQCKTRLKVEHDGDVTALGPKDEPLSKAEDLQIKEDRVCSLCKHHLSAGKRTQKWLLAWCATLGVLYLLGFLTGWGVYWKIGGAILLVLIFAGAVFHRFVLCFSSERGELCLNTEARSVTGRSKSEALPEYINRNLRCKFWEKTEKA